MFDKWEEKEVDAKTGNVLLVNKQAKLVRVLENGNLLVEVKVVKPKAEVASEPKEEDIGKDDIAKKENVVYEIMRKKGEAPIIMHSGKLSKRKEFVDFKLQGVWRRYFPNNFIKRTMKGKTSYLARFNPYYSEALKSGQTIPEYDQALENHMLYDWAQQYKKAIGAVAGLLSALARDRSIQFLILLAFLFGVPIGMGLWPQVFPQPNTVVHWVP